MEAIGCAADKLDYLQLYFTLSFMLTLCGERIAASMKRTASPVQLWHASPAIKQKKEMMNVQISIRKYADHAFPRIDSDLHTTCDFHLCAQRITNVLLEDGMRYSEAYTLLEQLTTLLYQASKQYQIDMPIEDVKQILEEEMP